MLPMLWDEISSIVCAFLTANNKSQINLITHFLNMHLFCMVFMTDRLQVIVFPGNINGNITT